MPALDSLSPHALIYVAVALIAAVVLLARRVPVVGRVLSLVMTLGVLGLAVMLLNERAAFDPALARIAQYLKLDNGQQQVVGKEMRIPMARDGHFWVRAKIGDTEQRMLVDSGATITALSAETAKAAGLHVQASILPMLIQTANGSVPAGTARIRTFRIGNIVARDMPVVVSPAFGDMNVVGMNFLSRLKSWRVEDGTMILTPHHPQGDAAIS